MSSKPRNVERSELSESRNPYVSGRGGPRLRNSVFAFLDVLGYRAMLDEVVSGKQEELLRRLHVALRRSRHVLEDRDVPEKIRNLGDRDPFALKAFTDNIVIGWPIYDDGESEFGHAVGNIGAFQLEMAIRGFFVRGAIAVGPAFVDDIAVFGQALTEAHVGESQLARDPRIILTDSAVTMVRRHLSYYGDPRSSPQSRHLLCDTDGQWFANYLHQIVYPPEDSPRVDALMRHRNEIRKRLKRYRSKPPIWSKYAWAARYHNYFCGMYDFSDSAINSTLLESGPTLIV